MTPEQANECINILSTFYNKSLEEYQKKSWVKELMKVQLKAAQKAIGDIKTNPMFQQYMPTIPNFLTICNKNCSGSAEVNNKDFCFVCMDKGHSIVRIVKKIEKNGNEEKYTMDLALHCDYCEKGNNQKYDGRENSGYFTEPISKYFDANELVKQNKEIKEKNEVEAKERKEKALERISYFVKQLGKY